MRTLKMIARVGMLLAFCYLGILIGCSTTRVQDSDLKPYVDRFIKDMDMDSDALKNYSIRFLSLEDADSKDKGATVVGRCFPIINIVDIDPKFWYNASERQKIALMHHELGHCACKIMLHVNEVGDDYCPVSLMNKATPPSYCLKRHWKSYIDDLYERCY